MYYRSDMHSISLTVDGTPLGWLWTSFEGGNLEADDGKVRPGGMGGEISLGGPASRQDATLQTPFTDLVLAQHKTLEAAVITSAPVTASITMWDRTRNPFPKGAGSTFSIKGTLKSTKVPNLDTTSADPGMYEVVISCDEVSP